MRRKNSVEMKHLRYIKYIVKHKFFVFIACLKRGMIWQGIMHDISKLSPTEWGPYAEHHYGDNPKIKRDKTGAYNPLDVSPEYDRAWLHHVHNNPHHWQHWVSPRSDGTYKVLPIPDKYLKEMVCDFWGAGMAQGKPDIIGWYKANKDSMVLHEESRKRLEELLGYREE